MVGNMCHPLNHGVNIRGLLELKPILLDSDSKLKMTKILMIKYVYVLDERYVRSGDFESKK